MSVAAIDENTYSSRKSSSKRVPVIQMTLEGKLVAIYHSITEAYNATKVRYIEDVVKGIIETAGGYKWVPLAA